MARIHHHASLCIAAYGFLVSEKETFPPSGPARTLPGRRLGVPAGHRPRGSPVALTTAHAKLNHNLAHQTRAHSDKTLAKMPMLRRATIQTQ